MLTRERRPIETSCLQREYAFVQGLMVGALVEPIERLPPEAPTPQRALMQRAFRHRKIIERSQRVTGVIGPSVHK
jgi:hypothetical protein